MNNRNDQFRRLFDARSMEDGYSHPRPPAPESCGLSHQMKISQFPNQKSGTIIENRADDIDVQLVTFSVDANSDSSRSISPVLHVEWGCGGTQHEADINIKKGVIFTLGCSYYRLIASAEHISEDDVGSIITFRASAAYGSHPGAREPTREFLSDLNPIAPPIGPPVITKFFEIPPYAIRASVLGNLPAQLQNGNVTVEFFGDVADPFHVVYNGLGPYSLRDMTFGADHKIMAVTNTSGLNMDIMAQFELGF